MKFWPFPLLRNNATSPAVTRLFLAFAQDETLTVNKGDLYTITVCGKFGELSFWDANHYYGWAHEGVYKRPSGAQTPWRNMMPSRYAVRLMRKAIADKTYSLEERLVAAIGGQHE